VTGAAVAGFRYRHETAKARNNTGFRGFVFSWLIVIATAFHVPAAAAADLAASEDVPVPGGTAAFAGALAIDPAPDRGRFIFEVTRLVHENPAGRKPAVLAFLQALAIQPRGTDLLTSDSQAANLVPVPLTADVWSRAVFKRKIAKDELVGAIVASRIASLLCHGLAMLDDETLAYFAEHSSILGKLAERAAPAFGPFANSLRIRGNRVVPPGAPEATPLWESVVGEKVTRPDAFILRLYEASDGRLAYLFDTIGQLDPPRRAFTLGMFLPPPTRADRFRALATSGIAAYRDWHIRTLPFSRGSYDLAMTLMRVAVDEHGAPRAPAARAFWSRVFASNDLPDDPARQLRGNDEEPFDAAWLTEAVGAVDVRQRADRLNQIAFAQRLFATASDRPDVLVAVRAVARYQMLMLTLERIGLTAPSLYAAAARQAAKLTPLDAQRGFVAQAQFQGALALVARMTAVRTIDVATAQHLIERLIALPVVEDGHYKGAVAHWIRGDLLKAAATSPWPNYRNGGAATEAAIVAALSGPASATGGVTRLTWEGERYRLDLGAAERLRLERVRVKQEGLPIDIAVDLASAGRLLTDDKTTTEAMHGVLARVTAIATDVPERSRQEDEDNLPPGVSLPPGTHAILRRTAEDLSKALKSQDVKRAPRIGEPLLDLSDELLSQALLSFAYAADLGDPEGAILLADDVSRRHDFGFGVKDGEIRARTAWMQPHQDVAPGVAWHVTGSLLGMDVALAPLALRRVNFDRVLDAPRLTSNQREAFAVSVAFMNPFSLRDEDRDAIVVAIDRGRRRLAAFAAPADLEAMASELAFDGARRRASAWTFAHERNRLESMVSLTELLVLGGGAIDSLNAWGMSMLATSGCLCSRLTPPGRWSTLMGRPQLGVSVAGMADLNLLVAMRLKELRLPAALARVVLSAAMQDFIDGVKPTDEADWITMARAARTLTREEVEDYVAAATAAGPLMPDNGPSSGRD
jgi:hypothetical protein